MSVRTVEYVSWNPWHGCTKVSPGCRYCYVYRQDERYGDGERARECRKTANFNLPTWRRRDGGYKVAPGSMVMTCFTSDCLLEDADGAQRRFLRAVTCRGLFQSAPPAGAVQLVSVEELEALRARPGAVWYQNPLFPDVTEAVWLPGEARYYRGPDTPLPELSDVFSLLAQAKALHDELEAVYNPHVDFARVYALAHAHALQLLG